MSQGISRDEIEILADARYDDIDDRCDRLFCLLVEVADAYRSELERGAAFDPAPYFGVTPLTALLRGLGENLEMRRDPTYGMVR